MVAFSFLLQVGEYTMPALNRQTRTVQFRVKDMKFYKNSLLIPNTPPLSLIAQSDGVTLCISNQKNGTQGETIYQHALPGRNICPVLALAQRVVIVMAATHNVEVPILRLGTHDATRRGHGHAASAMIQALVYVAV